MKIKAVNEKKADKCEPAHRKTPAGERQFEGLKTSENCNFMTFREGMRIFEEMEQEKPKIIRRD